jgi:hypothetical protein
MNNILIFKWMRYAGVSGMAVVLMMLLAGRVHAQGLEASGTVGPGAGPANTYDLSFSDAAGATTSIGSVWYAWTPGNFYLPGTPATAGAPSGWTANIFDNSIQFEATSAANDIAPGQSLPGFSFQASFTMPELTGAANSGLSVAYSGINLSGTSENFTVTPVPEPAVFTLLICGLTGLSLATLICLPRK